MVRENEKGRGQEKYGSTRGSKPFFGCFCLLCLRWGSEDLSECTFPFPLSLGMAESCVSDPALPLFLSPFPFPAASLWDTQPSGCLLQHEPKPQMSPMESGPGLMMSLSFLYIFSTAHLCPWSTLPFCIPSTFMFPLSPRTFQHYYLVSSIFQCIFPHVSLLPVSTGSTIPLLIGISSNPIHPGSRH